MPIYEYRCRACRRKSSFLTLSVKTPVEPICKQCGSTDMEKLVPRVAMLHSEESRFERLADPSSMGDVDENDPRSVARWMKTMGREMGEEAGDDFDEDVDRAAEEDGEREESGESGPENEF
jgi:putative FmdB family regulatory protein